MPSLSFTYEELNALRFAVIVAEGATKKDHPYIGIFATIIAKITKQIKKRRR